MTFRIVKLWYSSCRSTLSLVIGNFEVVVVCTLHITIQKSLTSLVSKLRFVMKSHDTLRGTVFFSYVHKKQAVQVIWVLICSEKTRKKKTTTICFFIPPLTPPPVHVCSHWRYLASLMSFSHLRGFGKITSFNSSHIEQMLSEHQFASDQQLLSAISKNCRQVENQCLQSCSVDSALGFCTAKHSALCNPQETDFLRIIQGSHRMISLSRTEGIMMSVRFLGLKCCQDLYPSLSL